MSIAYVRRRFGVFVLPLHLTIVVTLAPGDPHRRPRPATCQSRSECRLVTRTMKTTSRSASGLKSAENASDDYLCQGQ
jgi:hypothetical protein